MKQNLATKEFAFDGMTKDDQCTPDFLLSKIRQVGPIVLDPTDNEWSKVDALVRLDGSPGRCGLGPWAPHLTPEARRAIADTPYPVVYGNPPYSAGRVSAFVERFVNSDFEDVFQKTLRIFLVPVSGSASWFQIAMSQFDVCILINKRLKFRGSMGRCANFSSALFVAGPQLRRPLPRSFVLGHLGDLGVVVTGKDVLAVL